MTSNPQLVHVATDRPIGLQARDYVYNNLPEGWGYTAYPEQSDVFISVMYAKLVSEDFIAPRRCYNIHPGILPEYRGSGAFSWALINEEKFTGVTLHELDVDIDNGPIIDYRFIPIRSDDTSEDLFNRACLEMLDLLKEHLISILNHTYNATTQDEEKAKIYYKKDLKKAKDLTRFIRAFTFEGKENAFYITKSGHKRYIEWDV